MISAAELVENLNFLLELPQHLESPSKEGLSSKWPVSVLRSVVCGVYVCYDSLSSIQNINNCSISMADSIKFILGMS